MKLKIPTILSLSAALLLPLAGCASSRPEKPEAPLSVYLWSTDLIYDYAPYIQAQLPDIEIEFIVGNNDLDFYEFLNENGSLPDIITNRRFSLNDAVPLQPYLLDLSTTEAAASIGMPYLSNYQNSDGSINWLPICGVADTILANKALFDEYAIPIPTDYDSFVFACKAFEKQGIRGFVSDFSYDYTCLEVLQGCSISELVSLEGKKWRLDYENPVSDTIGLDTEIWPGVFKRMEQFISDVGLLPSDTELSFNPVVNMFTEGKAAMTRNTGAIAMGMTELGVKEVVLLPYFCQDGNNWLLTYPSLHVALNRELKQDAKHMEQASRVLRVMLSEEGQNVLSRENDTVSYSKNTEITLAEELSGLKPYIQSNHLYIRLASEAFFAASQQVVQKMIQGDYDAQQAYEAFDAQLRQPQEKKSEAVVTFDRTIPYTFQKEGGNPAASAVANTLREYYDADILLSPAYNFTGPILPTDYTKKMLSYMIMPNSCEAFVGDMTGAEIKRLLQISVEGADGCFTPFNQASLPVLSGASMEVKANGREYTLTRVYRDGKELEETRVYRVAYLDTLAHYTQIVSRLCPEQDADAFEMQKVRVRSAWTEYMANGHPLREPTDYIVLH